MLNAIQSILIRALYFIYLYFAYHLLLMPAFAEYSYYALLVVPFLLFLFWLIPAKQRKEFIVLTFLFLFVNQAIANIASPQPPLFYVWVIFIGLFLFPIVKWYAKIRLPAMITVMTIALLANIILPERMVLALPHLYPKWNSDRLYIGKVANSFPVSVADMNQDGKDDVITLGNADDYPDGKRKDHFTYKLENEPLHPFVWTWSNGSMERLPAEQVNQELVRDLLPNDYIGFPYYVLNENLELEPLVQRHKLTEAMMRFGAAPYHALLLNLQHMQVQFQMNDYSYDQKVEIGSYQDLLLKDGVLRGTYQDKPFSILTPASKIIGTITLEVTQLGQGQGQGQAQQTQQGLLVIGRDVELLQEVEGEMKITHQLTREMQSGLATSQFMTSDLNRNGKEEFIVTYPLPALLEPKPDGSWNILWGTNEQRSLRIMEIGSFKEDGPKEILALRKSLVRASATNYLTSYTYSNEKLIQNWKIFLRNINTVSLGDLDGDGKQELITTVYGTHKVYIWGKHSIPVTPILIILTLFLTLYLAARRYTHAKQKK